MKHRLTARITAAVVAVGAVFTAAIVILGLSIVDLRQTSRAATATERTLQAAQRISALVVDIETGMRGYVITRQGSFLEPYDRGIRELPGAGRALSARPIITPDQARLTRLITREADAYVREWARPVIDIARTDRDGARSKIATADGKRRVDALRADVAEFSAAVEQVALDRADAAEDHGRDALWLALAAGILAITLVALLAIYLTRSVAAPIRRAAVAAGELGDGDLSVRLHERRADEIGRLSDAFNAMGLALQENAAEIESQHAELETQNGELERQAVELESQATELEAQTAELEDGAQELTDANSRLTEQKAALEATGAALREVNDRVEMFARAAEALSRRTSLGERADVLLGSLADMTAAPVGVLYCIVRHGDEQPHAVALRGLHEEDVSPVLAPGGGLAGRAAVERRTVVGSHGQGALRLRTLGGESGLRHEVHTPLIVGDDVLGVLSLGRTIDAPFSEAEIAAVEHLSEQGAVSLGNALDAQRTRWLADLNRAVLDSTGDGIYMLDATGERLLANPEMDRFLRDVLCEGADVEGRTTAELAKIVEGNMTDPAAYRRQLGMILESRTYEGTQEMQLAGSGRWVRRYTAPVTTRAGDWIGRIFVYSETTEQHEAQRVKDELMSTVSHELRTPLSAILGFTELLMARDYGEDERREYLATVHQQASRLSDLISDFLDLQRLEHHDESITLSPIDLREILDSQVSLFAKQSRQHLVELHAAQAADLRIAGDAERLRRALANLLSNAIKYSPDGGAVTVEAERSGDEVVITVSDRGLGIPASAQDRIFERFFRVDSSETSRIGGTGLGLSLVREIARAHDGDVGFSSVEGEGSRFWIRVPAAGAAGTA